MNKIEKLVAANAGRRARQEAEAKRKASLQKVKKLKSPSTKSRTSRRVAGRIASKRGGIGVVIKFKKNGSDPRRAANYAMQEKKINDAEKQNKNFKRPEIVAGNVLSVDEFVRACEVAKKQTKKEVENIGHFIISLPPQTNFDLSKLGEMADEVMRGLEISEDAPYMAVQHFDEAHPHVHVFFSRIDFNGKIHDQCDVGLRAASVAQNVEQKYDLNLLPRRTFDGELKPTSAELEKTLRTGELSTKMQLQLICNEAMLGVPSMPEYLERLSSKGVSTQINFQENDAKLTGLLFELDGKKMKASDLGKKFTTNGLKKEGIIYDKTRDFEQLKKLAKPTSAGFASDTKSATRSEQNAAPQRLERGVLGDSGADANYEKADDSSNFGVVSQPSIHPSFDLANPNAPNASASSTRDSTNIKTTKPNKQPEKDTKMSRFTDQVEWIQMHNERTIGRRDVDMQYGGRMNRRLKLLNIQNFEGIDFLRLDCEVAQEMLEAGVPGYDISRTIFQKSPHDYSDLGQVRGTVEAVTAKLKSTKEQAEKAAREKMDKQTAMNKEIQENTNSYWKPPTLD